MMKYATITRRGLKLGAALHSTTISVGYYIYRASIKVMDATSRLGVRVEKFFIARHIAALEAVRNKARSKHVRQASAYSQLQSMHTTVERQMADVRRKEMSKLLAIGIHATAVEDAVEAEINELRG